MSKTTLSAILAITALLGAIVFLVVEKMAG